MCIRDRSSAVPETPVALPARAPAAPARCRHGTRRPPPRSTPPTAPAAADSRSCLHTSFGFPLPTLDESGVQVEGGDLLLRAAPPQLLHHVFVHLRQAAQGRALSRDVTHPPAREFPLRLLDLRFVMKLVEKLPRGHRTGHLMPQHFSQARVFP